MMQGKASEMAATQTIPTGYKQTEVGIIPEDWRVSTVGNEYEIKLGKMLDSVKNRGVPKLFLGNRAVQWGYIDISDLSTVPMSRSDIEMFRLCDGDLLVCEGGEVGRAAIWNSPISECYYQKALHRLRPLHSFNSQLMASLLRYWADSGFLRNYVTQTSIAHLPREKFMEVPMPIPPVYEQTAIASTLCDTDALLTGLEQLIAKKQAIKTAAMQQLLTGRTRLPQFALRPDGTPKGYKSSELGQIPEDWEVLAIDDCATKVGSGKTPNGGASVYIDAGRPFVRSQNIGWGKLILDDVAYISDDIHNTFSGSEIKEDDVLLNITGASIGRCAITEGYIIGGNVNQHVCIIRLNSVLLNARLLVGLINSRNGQKQIDSYQAGGNREGLNFQQVRQLKFAVSNSSVEQTAIATILSDMDNELTALEQKLAKARDVKQGMMQQLLTGRIRLPLPQEA
ncbi:restriction endonuclease subunit S [Aeromonas veronii]|uniref:restriction endonuclease subunit S n=1 Tax=Aeromonas veronii TaxID=654 RepID=UPI0031FCED85